MEEALEHGDWAGRSSGVGGRSYVDGQMRGPTIVGVHFP